MKYIFTLLIIFTVSFFTAYFTSHKLKQPLHRETVYERVLRTKALRCGYQIYPPFSIQDTSSENGFKGIYPDIMHEFAKQAGIKIIWAEELGSDTMFTSLQTGRVDALCTPVTSSPARAQIAAFTPPFLYVPFYVYVRHNETRFDHKIDMLNSNQVTFVVKDGDLIEILAKQYFPKAKLLSLPGLTDAGQMYLSVATRKADAIIGEPVFASTFMANNPGALRQVQSLPVQTIPGMVATPIDDMPLYHFISRGLRDLEESGAIKTIVDQYIDVPGAVLMPALPYQSTL